MISSQEGRHIFRGFAAAQLILELRSLRVNTVGVNPQSQKAPPGRGWGWVIVDIR